LGVGSLAREVEARAHALLDCGRAGELAEIVERPRLAIRGHDAVFREAERIVVLRIRARPQAEARVEVQRAVLAAEVAAADLEEAARRELVVLLDRRRRRGPPALPDGV